MSRRVIVVGAGIAGIAAAAQLFDAGWHVTLIERRSLLGGRATSFEDETSGQLLDNCQHVLLGCCTALRQLYRRLGVESHIRFYNRIAFKDEQGRSAQLYTSPLPAPFHLSPAMAGFGLLTWRQKSQIARGMLTLMQMRLPLSADLYDITFADWLHRNGQSADTIARFWNVIITSALNEDAAKAAAGYGIQVFKEGFLADRHAWEMGVPTVPLADLYGSAVASRILTGTRVTALRQSNGNVIGVQLADGTVLDADTVLIATAPDAARKLLQDVPGTDDLRADIDRFTFGTIIGAHLFYDRPVMKADHVALVGTELQWLFRKDADGRHIHGVISAADTLATENNDTLARRFDAEVKRLLLPAARRASLEHARIVKEKRATWAPVAGIEHHRPQQQTSIPGLCLAGDYTRTGWPATMEGAARSGQRAAHLLITGKLPA